MYNKLSLLAAGAVAVAALAILVSYSPRRAVLMTTPVRQILPQVRAPPSFFSLLFCAAALSLCAAFQAILPSRYELFIEPDLVNFTFAGVLRLHTTVHQTTSQLQLNAEEIDVQAVTSDVGDAAISYQKEQARRPPRRPPTSHALARRRRSPLTSLRP